MTPRPFTWLTSVFDRSAPRGNTARPARTDDSAGEPGAPGDHEVLALLRKQLRNPPASGDPHESLWRQDAQELLDEISPDILPHGLVRRIERLDLKIRRGLSFKALMVQESESRRLGLPAASWLLDQKLAAYRFIDELDVRRPVSDLKTYRFSDLPIVPPIVIKPRRSTGSKGCYLITSEHDITHIKDGVRLDSFAALRRHAESLMYPRDGKERPLPDRWFAEELILKDGAAGTPARDLKYFCFYGEVLFYLEVRRRAGKSEYSFRTPEHEWFIPGSWEYDYFEGSGTSADEMDLAKQISLEIPHPFCRIDLLKGQHGLVFGEFTPRPGGYHRFSAEWDRRMGEAWVRAQHRLQMDLQSGRDFASFARATKMFDSARTT